MALLFSISSWFLFQGLVCLDILKEQWSPAFSIKKILSSISYLLQECNPGMYVCMYVRTYVCMYVHNVYMCVIYIRNVCMYVCMYVCVYVCAYLCMYVCMLVCTYVGMYRAQMNYWIFGLIFAWVMKLRVLAAIWSHKTYDFILFLACRQGVKWIHMPLTREALPFLFNTN